MNMEKFYDRLSAGEMLAKKLRHFANKPNTIILALPRGGVPIAYEIAKELTLPLDILIVRKLGFPGNSELAIGAIAIEDTIILNKDIIQNYKIQNEVLMDVIRTEKKEINRRNTVYRNNSPFPSVFNRNIILVDDGIATGATIRAAITVLRKKKVNKIILAIPVAEKTIYKELTSIVDEIICPLVPENLYAVGVWYEHFPQITDDEVTNLLKK